MKSRDYRDCAGDARVSRWNVFMKYLRPDSSRLHRSSDFKTLKLYPFSPIRVGEILARHAARSPCLYVTGIRNWGGC